LKFLKTAAKPKDGDVDTALVHMKWSDWLEVKLSYFSTQEFPS
jgi:hypothetical protein